MGASTTVGMCQEGIPGDKGKEGQRTGQRSSLTLGLAQEQTGHGYKLGLAQEQTGHRYKLDTGTNLTQVQTGHRYKPGLAQVQQQWKVRNRRAMRKQNREMVQAMQRSQCHKDDTAPVMPK